MKQTMKYLNDEHMRLYEWNGLGALTSGARPARAARRPSWQASYGVLAVLTSLLILNGCDNQRAAEEASEQVGQAVQEPQPLYDDSMTAPAHAAAPAAEGTDGAAVEGSGEAATPATAEPGGENAAQPGDVQQP
jgi:hypothetical protein